MTTKNNQIDEEGILREGEIKDTEDDELKDEDKGGEGKDSDTQSSKGDNKDGAKDDDEEDVPFHKHPRWIAKQQEMDDLKKQIEDLEELTRKTETKDEDNKDSTPIPQEFIDLFGNDKAIWDKWQKLSARQREDIKKEVTEELQNKEQSSAKAIEDGKKYVEESLTALEKSGQKFDRNDLIKFMIDFEAEYAPILNKEGNYDFAKGLELMQKVKSNGGEDTTKTQDIEAKKKLGSIEKKSGGEEDKPKVPTTRDIRNKSFNTLASED